MHNILRAQVWTDEMMGCTVDNSAPEISQTGVDPLFAAWHFHVECGQLAVFFK